jgi:predicted amidohydrolase
MNVHLVQFDIAWEDHAANHDKIRGLLQKTPPDPGSLVVLPEMAFSGFSLEPGRTAQGTALEDENFLRQMAAEYRCAVLGGLVSATGQGRGANQSVVFAPDGAMLARYTKLQPFAMGGESGPYPAGRDIVTFQWGGFKIAPFICYDLRFPEHFRAAVKLGTELFVVIASWPVKRHHHWLTLLQARAIENLAFVIGVNRCGADPNFGYNGRSVVVSPHGHIIADAGEQERVLSARMDAAEVRDWRAQFPALHDMKI